MRVALPRRSTDTFLVPKRPTTKQKKGGEFITPALGTPERVSYFFFLLAFFLAAFFLRFAIVFASSLFRG